MSRTASSLGRSFAVCCILGWTGVPAEASAQCTDVIVIDGREYSLAIHPLEGYLSEHPAKRPEMGFISTGLWRRYVANFAVEDDRLLVTDVTVPKSYRDRDTFVSVFAEVFSASEPIVASWFTGHLVIPDAPDGERVRALDMNYIPEAERYFVLEVRKGTVANRWRMDRARFTQWQSAQFAAFKKTDRYRSVFDVNVKGRSSEKTEAFLFRSMAGEYTAAILE